MNLALSLLFLHYFCITIEPSNGYEPPYMLVAVGSSITALKMDGTVLNLTLFQGFSRIEAMDYHYRMQQVYWVTFSGEIKRGDLNDLTVETIAHSKATDIAVDWIQDILYWIIAGESKIYRLNITSADPTQEEVEVNGVNGRTIFADMVLNPISRAMYVMDVASERLMEIDYTGMQIRDLFTYFRLASCLTLSYSHDAIIWYQVASEIHVQGLSNQFAGFFHTIPGEHVVQTQFYGDRIYWVQRSPTMGVYSKQWNELQGDVRTITEFRSDRVVKDMVIVHPSNQLTSGISVGGLAPSKPVPSATTTLHVGPTPFTSATAIHTTTTTEQEETSRKGQTGLTPLKMKPTLTGLSSTDLMSVVDSTISPQSTGPALSSQNSMAMMESSSYYGAASHTTYTLMPSLTAEHSTVASSTGVHVSPTSVMAIESSRSESETVSSAVSESRKLTNTVSTSQLVPTAAPAVSVTAHTPLQSSEHSLAYSVVSTSQTSVVPDSSEVPTLSPSEKPATPPHTNSEESSTHTDSMRSSASTPVYGGLNNAPLPSTASTVLVAAGSHDSHMTTSHTQTQSPISATSEAVIGSTATLSDIQPSPVVQQRDAGSSNESEHFVFEPSVEVYSPGGTQKMKETSTLEAVVITLSCLGLGVLVFVGLAVLDAAYYFSYERKQGKGVSSGVLGVMWKLLTLPCYCLLFPRYMFRRRRKSRYPYVPKCLGSNETSMYATDLGRTTNTTDLNDSTVADYGYLSADRSSSSGDQSGSHTGHSGSATVDQSNQPSAETDLTILSSNDGISDSACESSIAGASLDTDYDDYQGPLPTPEVMQLQLETKAALGETDIDDHEFEKVDLSSQ